VSPTVPVMLHRGLTTSIYHKSPAAPPIQLLLRKSTAGGTTSLTLNFSGSSTYLLVAVAEVAGLDPPRRSINRLSRITHGHTAWSSAQSHHGSKRISILLGCYGSRKTSLFESCQRLDDRESNE